MGSNDAGDSVSAMRMCTHLCMRARVSINVYARASAMTCVSINENAHPSDVRDSVRARGRGRVWAGAEGVLGGYCGVLDLTKVLNGRN